MAGWWGSSIGESKRLFGGENRMTARWSASTGDQYLVRRWWMEYNSINTLYGRNIGYRYILVVKGECV